MFADVSGNVVVGVIVAFTQVKYDWNSGGPTCFHQVFRKQLLLNVKFVARTLVDE